MTTNQMKARLENANYLVDSGRVRQALGKAGMGDGEVDTLITLIIFASAMASDGTGAAADLLRRIL